MGMHKIVLYVWIYTFASLGIVRGDVNLTPTTVLVDENTPVTLTCTYVGSRTVQLFTWVEVVGDVGGNDDIPKGKIAPSSCSPFGITPEDTKYEYRCVSNNQMSWTIKNINRSNKGETWACRGNIEVEGIKSSNGVSISVRVLGIVWGQVNLTPTAVLVDENNPVTLTCTYVGSGTVLLFTWFEVIGDVGGVDDITRGSVIQPSCTPFRYQDVTKYNYSCVETKQMSWTIKNINISNEGDTWACSVTVSETGAEENSNGVSISVRVPIQSVSMTLPSSDATLVVVENKEQRFKCSTDGGLPIADIAWYKDNKTPGTTSDDIKIQRNIFNSQTQENGLNIRTSTLLFYPSRSDGGNRIYCSASNLENQTPVISARKLLLTVLFAPSTPTIYYNTMSDSPISVDPFNVVVGDSLPIACSSEGQPDPSYTWQIDNKQYSGQRVVLPPIQRDMVATLKCIANNELPATGSTSGITRSSTATVTMNIMYPPDIPNIRLKYGSGTYTNILHSFNVLEGAAFVLDCQGLSKPYPSYQWFGRGAQNSTEFHAHKGNITRDIVHIYTCEVANIMKRTYGLPSEENDKNTANVSANVLYGPEVLPMSNQSAEEGKSFRYNCAYTPGNPAESFVKWTRHADQKSWNSALLEIVNVSKDDMTMYMCTVQNTMRPTNQPSKSDPKSGYVYLDVKYKASIEEFVVKDYTGHEVTVNEFRSPTLVCNVDSNPASNIKVMFHTQTLAEESASSQLKHRLSNVSCGDIGVYTCTSRNYLNMQALSTKDVVLLVKCQPQPFGDIDYTVYSAQRNPATLRLSALAYPIPSSIVWTKIDNKDETILKNNTELTMTTNLVKINGIHIDIMQLELKFHNVTISEFSQYKVKINNDVGTMEKVFFLEAEDIPDLPTEFGPISGLIKTTEATIQWKPGFNGGPIQTFVLLYKKLSDIEWKSIYVTESGDVNMNYTLTKLESNTPYQVKIYAHNRIGNSSVSEDANIRTLEAMSEDPESHIGTIVGGAFGGAVLAGLVAFAIVFLLRRRRATCGNDSDHHNSNERDQIDENKFPDDASYYNIGREVHMDNQSNSEPTYYNEGCVPDYETLNQQNRDFTTYSSLQSSNSGPTEADSSGENKTYENLQLRVM